MNNWPGAPFWGSLHPAGAHNNTLISNPVKGHMPPAHSVPHHSRTQMEDRQILISESCLVKPLNNKKEKKFTVYPK